jgi:hypothetical protein
LQFFFFYILYFCRSFSLNLCKEVSNNFQQEDYNSLVVHTRLFLVSAVMQAQLLLDWRGGGGQEEEGSG